MSRLEDLLQTLCPDGVDFVPLEQVLDYSQPTPYIVKSTRYDDSYDTPVLTAGASFILGYTDETKGIYVASSDKPVIIFDDFTTSFHWVDFKFKVKSSAMKILTEVNQRPAVLRYVFYAMQCISYQPSSHARQWIQTYSKIQIPLPPLPVQEEIVRILDTFSGVVTELEQKLEAEQAARVRQYEHYRKELLEFDTNSKIMEKLLADNCLDRVQYVKLKEVAHISAGGDLPENYVKGQKVPTEQFPFPIYSNGTDDNALYGFTDNYKIEKEAVTISARGTIGYHEVRAGKFTPIVRLITMIADESKITTKFLNYVLNIAGIEGVNTGIPSLTVPMLEKITIPLPPLEVQEQIVSILDRFDTLVNDLKSGLPAEIALRRKQYEFYRDKLLTFEPKPPF